MPRRTLDVPNVADATIVLDAAGVTIGVAVGFGLPTLLFSAEPPKEAFANAFGFRSQADGAPGGDGAGGLLLSNEATRPSGSAESAASGDSDVP